MDCNSIDDLKKVLVTDLRNLIKYDMGSLRWVSLDPDEDSNTSELMEEEMDNSIDFSTSKAIRIGDRPVCNDENLDSLEETRYMDCFDSNYRARSEMGDPVLLSFRSAIFIPLRYRDDIIGALSLFSTNKRRSDPEIERIFLPVWSMIGKTLGRILETQSLKDDVKRSRDLLDGTDDLIILWRNTGSMWEIDCNGKAEDLMDIEGTSPDLMEGPFFVPPGREWERAFVAWTAAFQSGDSKEVGLDLRNKRNETVSYLCRFSPLVENGNLTGVRMTGVEMEMLDSGAKKLESSNRTYRLLLSVLSHDLRNPLTAIRGYNELMVDASPEKREHYVYKVTTLTRRMNDMIHLANAFTKLQEGEIESTFEIIDMREMIDRCLELLYPRTQDHRIVFTPGDSNFKIKGHKLVEQVVLNLIENAMKYSEKGSDIVIDLKTDLSGVEMSISDEGAGVPDRYKESIFQRFSRIKKTSGILGSGLGLAISKEIVIIHGGSIWVEDNEKGGATFNVFLPWEP